MPKYYKTSKVIDNINNSNSIELTAFNDELNNILNQFFVDTADYTLERWEKELGIEVNNNYDINFRRSRIKSKLRGQGTVTVSLIKNISESFSNGEVDVIEDNANYNFTIKFISILGIPPNMDDLQKAVEDIKPAHLGFIFAYTYNTYNTISGHTHDELAVLTNDEIRTHQF
jgi:uncharacterized protein YmfQ (DUF2313 family)